MNKMVRKPSSDSSSRIHVTRTYIATLETDEQIVTMSRSICIYTNCFGTDFSCMYRQSTQKKNAETASTYVHHTIRHRSQLKCRINWFNIFANFSSIFTFTVTQHRTLTDNFVWCESHTMVSARIHLYIVCVWIWFRVSVSETSDLHKSRPSYNSPTLGVRVKNQLI